jgi:hypothetical protein
MTDIVEGGMFDNGGLSNIVKKGEWLVPEIEGLRTRIANTLDDQRGKRPGSRDRINEIKDEMDRDVLRTRLADLIYGTVSWRDVNVPVAEEVADAVIRELQLGKEIGCGCIPDGSGSECDCSYRYCTTWSPCGYGRYDR